MVNEALLELKLQELELQEYKLRLLEEEKAWRFKPYSWQHEWFEAGRHYKQRMLMAANQVGKTETNCVELTYHLTGRYPENWKGYKFYHPINAWALGVSSEQIKKVLQQKLLGQLIDKNNNFRGGLIPNALIIHDSVVKGALKNSVKEIHIKHIGGGDSRLSFLSYEQGQAVLMGDIVDYALIDEEPRDPTIYPQVLTRTLNGNQKRGGLIALSFTPEWGTTELVHQFTENLQDGQYFKNVTWDDAGHLSEERKAQMLAALPEHQRDMRSKGIPCLGSGRIYPYVESSFAVEIPFIPNTWARINAIDFGWQNTGLVWMAHDRDTDTVYVYDARKTSQVDPVELALIMKKPHNWVSWAWPHDGHLPEKRTGKTQMSMYRDEGIKMLNEHATHSDGSMSVEAGILEIRQRFKTGRLKVANHLTQFFEEYRLYHRNDGKVVKCNDHILDAMRYGIMMLRHANTQADIETTILPAHYVRNRYK